ncbi:kinase-like domain-containing protein [Rhizophagus clarus]|uniref:Kinase-like domain-containing protein n=1 Tax=Rhizophagus clarus TaxID=94130 RepID=A0A8H3MEV4_9GLOM|nr:kinase-like domain-containing protein [Rhizophagus clarus]
MEPTSIKKFFDPTPRLKSSPIPIFFVPFDIEEKCKESNSAAAILHLPWWDACNQCIICDSKLESSTDSQKWCSNCLIVYTGCRYCLTTNIIFGMAEQSQCMKCKRIFLVNVNMPANITNNGEYILLKLNTHNFNQISNYVDNIDKNSNLLELYGFMKKLNYFNLKIYSQIEYNENYLEITIPIMFIPFNNDDEYVCFCCKAVYSKTILSKKKYCHNCLCWCIKHSISGSNIRCAINNLDIYINTTINNCDKHEPKILDFCNESWCENCSKILCFKQIVTDDFRNINYSYYEKNCRLCGKLIYNQLCSDCYSMSFEIIESNSTAPILHLPWWDAFGECIICDLKLKFSSSSQKLCSNCLIVYTGCRYCLTTNIIFGMTEQSQYPKWFPYSKITNLTKIAEGGYGKIYKASIYGNIVAIKEFLNSQDPSKYFLNEIKSLYQCYDDKFEYIIKCHGITKNPMTEEFMFIMKYANGGDLHNYLQENFTRITWKKKLYILWRISDGLQAIHEKDLYIEISIYGPEITDDTPEDFVNLMKKCWNSDPKKRPSAKQVCEKFNLWSTLEKNADHIDKFNQAEEIRLELIRTKSIGPEFNEKPHSKSIYKSRSLSSIISEYSSTNSSMNSLRQKFVTREYDLDINNIQSDSIIQNSLSELISEINLSGKQNIGNEAQTSIEENKYATREYEFDINDINVNQGQVQSPST